LLGMIVACMAVQLLVAFVQNRKTSLKMLREMLIVLTGMKPGFNAHAVMSGREMDEFNVIDAKVEYMACKGAEIACESIPGCVLQVYAILKGRDRSQSALVSVAVSALTTGFNSACMSFDQDGKTFSAASMHPELY